MTAFEWRFRVARLGYRVYGYHEKITKYEKAAHWKKSLDMLDGESCCIA